ncbi:MAG: Zn-dependent M16 (insulinase) family peptidase [Candidatus Azotimanducaceae bacterium]|jgi:Zn-dependent M16 (insulinase) family peptidase
MKEGSIEVELKIHPAFKHLRSHEVDTLNVKVHEFEHIKTGAMHYHLDSENDENVFMVAFRTVPMDSSGIAHVLEHTALCGSEKYPVRDPFFLMIRRSLNTFMNAFTTSDYTAYPFASQNSKDFNNLLDIYLDAVFFSRLDKLDFMQEGHRVEFETLDDPSTDLVYRGVVFNEMKGDTSSVTSVLYDAVKKHLFPTTTYHYNSGGDPEHIPDLTYENLLKFYQSHYHPSNAIFMTFGNKSAFDLQHEFENKALKKFGRSDERIEVLSEQRFFNTKRVKEPYAVDDKEDLKDKTHIVMAWLLGPNTDLSMLLKCNLLSDALLDTAASPLRAALENTNLGGAPSPLCGLEETNREMSFLCGIEASNVEAADDVESLILSTLENVAAKGVSQEKLEACLHQLELNQREIGGDGHPFGLQLIFSCMSAAIHRGDPIELLDLDPALAQLHEDIKNPNFISDLVKEMLLDNSHRVRVCLYPDANLSETKIQAEKQRLQVKKEQLTESETDEIISLSKALLERQNREEPLDVLPKVGLNDVSSHFSVPVGATTLKAMMPKLNHYAVGTNGIVYHQIVSDMPELDQNQLQRLPLYTQIVTEIGSSNRGYLDTQHLQHSVSGGIGAYTAIRGLIEDPEKVQAHLTFSSRGLNRNTRSMVKVLKDTFYSPNFNEPQRIRDLVKQLTIRRISSVNNNGHGLAMSAAASYFRPVSRLNYHLSGLEGIQSLKKLDKAIEKEDDLGRLIETFKDIQSKLVKAPVELLLVSEEGFQDEAIKLLEGEYSSVPADLKSADVIIPFDAPHREQAWITTTQVNYCASAFMTIPENHPDSAALSILGGVLRNGYLHKAIREQGGAYGGGAGHDSSNGLFRFYSYRDPNLMATFDAFEASVKWVIESDIHFDLIEESILGVISGIDAPGSPSGDARQAFHNDLFGRDHAFRRQARNNILEVSVDDIKRVAKTYLLKNSARAVVMSETGLQEIPSSFEIKQI